jgi:hypothetical protein
LFLSAVTFNQSTTATPAVESAPIVEAASATVLAAAPEPEITIMPEKPIVTIEEYVKTYFRDTPVLAEIARCESQYRHYTTNGKLLRGRVVNEDVGVMQVNETYHLAASKKLGYDIHTLDGNLGYAKYLYDKQGVRPWASSAACWDK